MLNCQEEGSDPVGRGLVKITTYIPYRDRQAIREMTKDGSKAAEHYRRAIRMYIKNERGDV